MGKWIHKARTLVDEEASFTHDSNGNASTPTRSKDNSIREISEGEIKSDLSTAASEVSPMTPKTFTEDKPPPTPTKTSKAGLEPYEPKPLISKIKQGGLQPYNPTPVTQATGPTNNDWTAPPAYGISKIPTTTALATRVEPTADALSAYATEFVPRISSPSGSARITTAPPTRQPTGRSCYDDAYRSEYNRARAAELDQEHADSEARALQSSLSETFAKTMKKSMETMMAKLLIDVAKLLGEGSEKQPRPSPRYPAGELMDIGGYRRVSPTVFDANAFSSGPSTTESGPINASTHIVASAGGVASRRSVPAPNAEMSEAADFMPVQEVNQAAGAEDDNAGPELGVEAKATDSTNDPILTDAVEEEGEPAAVQQTQELVEEAAQADIVGEANVVAATLITAAKSPYARPAEKKTYVFVKPVVTDDIW